MSSLYFHFPFCNRKCPYCHFYVTANRDDSKQQFLESLQREWDLLRLKGPFTTVYFGGGTPSLFPEGIEEVLRWIGPLPPDTEITVEANPEGAPFEKLHAAGVNRASIGVQSFDDNLLKRLGRKHTARQAKEAILAAKRAGISNLTIDLMTELPGQTIESWRETLRQVNDLPITHLSLYNLTFEPHTPFKRDEAKLKPLLPTQEESLLILEEAIDHFEKIGLKRYEISAFAREGFESKHNSGYWTARPFWGLGPSAFSYQNGRRYRNVASLSEYASKLKQGLSPIDFEETLHANAQMRERLAIELRLLKGVSLSRFSDELRPTLQSLLARGWLVEEEGVVRLSRNGALFYDSVATEII